jgi:hypothetical protein
MEAVHTSETSVSYNETIRPNIREDSFLNVFGSGHRRLGGVVVSVLTTGSKGCRFKSRSRHWIFMGDKNPQHTFLSDGM